MQTLLDEESQSRSPPKERPGSQSNQARSQSRSTSQTTKSVGRATESSVVAGGPGGKGDDRGTHAVGAEADLIFSTSVGESASGCSL